MKSCSFAGGLNPTVNSPFKSKQRDPPLEIARISIDPSSYNLTGLSNNPHNHALACTCPYSHPLFSMLSPHTMHLAIWLQCGETGSSMTNSGIMNPIVGLFYISLCAEYNNKLQDQYRNHPEAHGDRESDNHSLF